LSISGIHCAAEMARYRGPVEKLERRLGVDLGLKGERRLAGKSALEKRPYAPGQHGQRRTKISEYGLQLREKQNHGHILVDGKRVDIPSVRVKAGQKIEIREKSKTNPQILRAVELTNQTGMVEWVDVDKEKLFGIFTRIPEREEIAIPVEERLIVELYSK